MRSLWVALRILLTSLLLLGLAGCKFQPSIAPISWPTVPPQPFGQFSSNLSPSPFPFQLVATPMPPPPVFEGMEELDCSEPKGGDNHFGYCLIPGTDEFYLWGECVGVCPHGPYPGIQLVTVQASDQILDL